MFAILLFAELPLLGTRQTVLLGCVCLLAVPIRFVVAQSDETWTPYYKVLVYPLGYGTGEQTGYGLNVNNTWFQRSFDVRLLERPEELTEEAHAGRTLRFLAPFTKVKPSKVLVLGSGLGNDTATALRFGVDSVHAVDIDPQIPGLSNRFHPNKPYQDDRVRLIVDDARHFLSTSEGKYDLIIFGVLEARSLFSQFANLRLDNYVYTIEALESARAHLSPDGVLWLNIWVPQPWILDKFIAMMGETFGDEFGVLHGRGSHHYALVGGPNLTRAEVHAFSEELPGVEVINQATRTREVISIPTDDWPYVFYRTRRFPISYLFMLVSLTVVSLGAFRVVCRQPIRMHWEFFFLGAAFLQVETSAVVRMALVAGTTWTVNSAVFSGVLIFVLLANWYVSRRRLVNLNPVFIALFVSLLINAAFPFHALLNLPNTLAITIAAEILTIPVLFAGTIFSALLRGTTVASQALASNLLGAILGGFSEYLSMITGNRAMSLVALALYACAFYVVLRRRIA